MTKKRSKFGAQLRKFRRQEELTLKQLHIGTNLSVGYLSMLERGTRICPLATFQLILDYLNLPKNNEEILTTAYHDARSEITIDLSKCTPRQQKIAREFAAKLKGVIE